MYNKGDEYAIPFERIIELAKEKPSLTMEEQAAWKERLHLEALYNEKFPDYPLAALHNMDLTDEEICVELKKCLETNTDWWTLRGDVYRDDVDY